MLNFNDTTLMKNQVYNKDFENNKKIDKDVIKFFDSRYHKKSLSDYIVVNKKERKTKDASKYK